MKKLILGIGLFFTLTFSLLSTTLSAKEVSADTEYNQAQLAQMLAPVALYPDSLLTHILIASTYPIEVVQADRWITKNKDLSASQIANKLEGEDWEPSIKALVMFPPVLKRLSEDLSWTQQLGDAFLQSEESVLQAIQDLRYQAQEAGNLDKMENVKVSREDKDIIIQPIQKEVIYVPYYDTRYVYGNWHWSLNPPIYWDWGHSVSYSHRRPFGWHSGIHISWNYFFSDFHWSNRHVVVINHRNTSRYTPKRSIVRSGYANRWVHNPHHRRGVSYRNNEVNKRYSTNRPVVRKTVTKHYNSPELYPHKKDYRTHQSSNKQVVKYKDKSHKVTKHEALQNKFKTRNILPAHKSAAVVHKNTVKNQVVNKGSDRRQKQEQQKDVKQKKTYSKNRETVRKESTVQHRTERPVFKETQPNRVVKRETTVKMQSKPQRTQRTEVRRSHSSSRNSGQSSRSRGGHHERR
ncbi:DUF3300 domain-containing protein [Colwellia sp. RE-S-Sl-9]